MDEHQTVRVMIVDDTPSVRASLTMVFQALEDIELVAEASNGVRAIELCSQHELDVILMDLMMPGMNGIEATHCIHQNYPDTAVIILTGLYDANMIGHAVQAGAVGHLTKDVSASTLVNTIREVAARSSAR